MNNRLVYALLLALSVSAASRCIAGDYFLRAQDESPNLYLTGGADFAKLVGDDGTESTSLGIPLDAQVIWPNDFTISLRSTLIHDDRSTARSLDLEGTVLSFGQGFRPRSAETPKGIAKGLDFVSLEWGYQFEGARSTGLSGDALFTRARFQGGWTRAGFDVNAIATVPAGSQDSPAALTFSGGYRGQFGRWHIGADYVTQRRGGDENADRRWADVIVMRRAVQTSVYVTASKRLTGGSNDWYAGIGFEYRREVPRLSF
jgi:hypothetical protein